MRRHPIILLALLLVATGGGEARAEATAQKDAADPQLLVLRNEQLRLVIDLTRGAHVVSCKYKGFEDAETVFDYKSENGGLFKDLWYTQGWPGEFDKRTYEAEIVKAGPDEVVVRTSTLSTGTYGNKQNSDLADLLLVKTFRLRQGERILRVDYEFTNRAAKGKRPAFWAQHAFNFEGQRNAVIYWRPTRHGVDNTGRNGEAIPFSETTAKGYWQTANITAGWNGAANRRLKRGVMFLMDYNDIQQVYDNWGANTLEWMYDDVAIPAGKTWRTSVQMIPTEGFAGYSHADSRLVAFTEGVATPAGISLTHTLAALAGELREVTVTTVATEVKGGWTVKGEELKLDKLGTAPVSRTLTLTGTGPLPCILEIRLRGKLADGSEFTAAYADFFDGQAGRNIDLTTLGPLREFPAPEKQKQYLKPDTIALQHEKPPRILFIRGLWAEYQGIDEAVKRLGEVTVVNGWMKKAALGETLGGFPGSYDDLLRYDVIILGNVSGPMLGAVGQEMIADFVRAGGGLLLLPGDRTYGQTRFSNATFARLLPVVCDQPGDYGRLKMPAKLRVTAGTPVASGCTFTGGELVLYAHTLKSADKTTVAATLDDGTPALVLSGDAAARVAAVTVLPFGEAPAGTKLFYETPAWQQLMANTLGWLLRQR